MKVKSKTYAMKNIRLQRVKSGGGPGLIQRFTRRGLDEKIYKNSHIFQKWPILERKRIRDIQWQ